LRIEHGYLAGFKQRSWTPIHGELIAGGRNNLAADAETGFFTVEVRRKKALVIVAREGRSNYLRKNSQNLFLSVEGYDAEGYYAES
jgi:hypothetical protein